MLENLKTNTQIPFPEKESYLILNGDSGNIELLACPKNQKLLEASKTNAIAIICHPHPLHGGTMNNKVVFTLHKAFFDSGYATVRFNFRGVGRTEGVHDNGIGEANDLQTVINWVKSTNPNCEIVLAGFSFGAFISFKTSKTIDCKGLVTVAPVIHHQDYNKYLPLSCPWLAVGAELDDIIPAQQLADWITENTSEVNFIEISGCDHFFHGKLPELKSAVIAWLANS